MSDIKCQNCQEITLQTTKDFDPKRPVHGGMIELKPDFKERGWSFCDAETPTEALAYENITCPFCGSWLTDSEGFLMGVIESFQCSCGRSFTHKIALVGHQRGCNNGSQK